MNSVPTALQLEGKDLLKECILAFTAAKNSLFEAAQMLWFIRRDEVWKDEYDSWTDFVQNGIKMDKGRVSKLLTSYEHFVVQNGVELAQLTEAQEESLYLASKMEGTVDEQLAKSLTLTRSELRAQSLYEKTGEEHECSFRCTVCGRSP